MLKTEVILDFCEKTNFFTSKPIRSCLIDAMRLDIKFGHFIKNNMIAGRRFSSAEDFVKAYKTFCMGSNGSHS